VPQELPETLRESIRAYFEILESYVILRNHDIEYNLCQGGDVDVLVGDINVARNLLCEILGRPLFSLRRTYVESHFYEWGHIDLTPRMEWRGAVFIANSSVLNGAEQSMLGFAKPRLAHEALICWFASLIWGGFFKERYAHLIERAATHDSECFLRVLTYAVGAKLGTYLFSLASQGNCAQSVLMVKSLRRALWLRAFARRPIGTLRGLISHYCREISLRARPPVPWFAIIGLDGSGKSTLIEGLQQMFRQIGLKTTVYHWRPKVWGGSTTGSEPVTDPHGVPPRHALTGLVKIPHLILDWIIGFYGPIADQRARGTVVIFDRYHADVIADPRRYRYSAATWWLKLVSRLLPQPTAVVLLDANPEDFQLRKRETTLTAAKSIRLGYLQVIKDTRNGFVVDASRDQQTVLQSTFNLFLSAMRSFSRRSH
jgi:thymidylate kinase